MSTNQGEVPLPGFLDAARHREHAGRHLHHQCRQQREHQPRGDGGQRGRAGTPQASIWCWSGSSWISATTCHI
ncbi:hypothetical protein [Nonomuraea sp. NPDC003709]|uniref:hypothetical protein n=1 Tax=Nonomuraea sp. NPDC003709 TaxID=3154450 RepID=UPI0033BF7F59